MSQFFYLFINLGILFNIGIGMGNVGLRLVIVIIAYKVFHRIFREKLFKFTAQLSRQSLIVGNNQSRSINLGNNIGHGIGFT